MIQHLNRMAEQLWQNAAIKFLAVGGFCALLQFGFLIAAVESGLLKALNASTVGYLLSALVNYVLNYYLTFASRQNHLETLPKFMLVVAIGATVNTGVFALAQHLLPWYWLCQCIATAASTAANFALHKFWIYRQPKRPAAKG